MECKTCKKYPTMIARDCPKCGSRYIGTIDVCGMCYHAEKEAMNNATEAEIVEPVVEEVAEAVVTEDVKEEEPKKFCDTCDSKGGRHKKDCPKYK